MILSMPERPDVEKLTVYYRNSMMTDIMKWFCRMSGKKKFTMQDMDNMERTAAFRAADRTPPIPGIWITCRTRMEVATRLDLRSAEFVF